MKDNIRFKNTIISSFIILIFLHISYSLKREPYNLLNNSKIILKINGSGPQRIFSDDYNGFPDSTKLKINNGNEEDFNTNSHPYVVNLENSPNIIEITWMSNLVNCSKMFSGCENITEVDLSGFVGTNVERFDFMFENCISLTSIIISDLDTSSAVNMSVFFVGCESLLSLNLSFLDTSKVNNMSSMFKNCSSLKYIDLSKLNTSSVQDMSSLFFGCKS